MLTALFFLAVKFSFFMIELSFKILFYVVSAVAFIAYLLYEAIKNKIESKRKTVEISE